MLRKFFNVYAIYENKSKTYVTKRLGSSKDINEAGNFLLLAPFLRLICWIISNPSHEYRIKKIWMPTVRIDATITASILKHFYEEEGKENDER